MANTLQGDSYKFKFKLTFNGDIVTPDTVDDVEIAVGNLIKTYAKGEVLYISERWYFPFTQAESFAWRHSILPAQVRLLFKTGDVIGQKINGGISVNNSISKEILTNGD